MFDFIIAILVTSFTNIYIVTPYWDKLKEFWLMKGHSLEQVSTFYNLLCCVSYLFIGFIIYFIIDLIKMFVKKSGEK